MASDHARVLDVGAGEHPHPDADLTLDIRTDLDGIDLPGVDIARDEWPVEDASLNFVVCSHVLEHVPPDRIDHVVNELARVLEPGGLAQIRVPHANTWGASTDPTHFNGWTPDVDRYFTDSRGSTAYWASLPIDVEAAAVVTWPIALPKRWRLSAIVRSGHVSHELVKLPLVDAEVSVVIRKEIRA